jgi:high-affinity nickel-transport protein
MISFLGILIFGFFLGMRHATDPDHVVAVMTIVSKQRKVARAGVIGALWGMGHTAMIFVVGAVIILFKVAIPPRLGLSMEFAVGLMLILLGILNLSGVMQRVRMLCSPSMQPEPVKPEFKRLDGAFGGFGLFNALRPLIIGTVHGLAGSAAVAILAMTTITDPWWAIAYLLLFGLGTVAGMAAMTMAMAVPIVCAGKKMFRWSEAISVGSGIVSVAFGMIIAFQIGIRDELFTGTPHWIPR